MNKLQNDLVAYGKRDGVDVNGVGPEGQKLVEYHSRKPKFPYIFKSVNGDMYKSTVIGARKMFGEIAPQTAPKTAPKMTRKTAPKTTPKTTSKTMAIELTRNCAIHDINAFGVGPEGQKLVEYHSRKPKFPFIFVSVDGVKYKATIASARKMFGSSNPFA